MNTRLEPGEKLRPTSISIKSGHVANASLKVRA
jgi:hypothetical protein